MSYECHIVLDFEFNPVKKENRYLLRDEIIEIGAVKLNPEFEEIGRFSCLIKPALNDFVNPKITELTGIKTADVINATDFESALRLFSEWIGPAKARIYSWSDNDLRQLRYECEAKEVEFPENMYRWMDIQKVYQRIIHYPSRICMALSYATRSLGITFNKDNAHRAIYDAEVTAEILRLIKSEEYISRQRKAHQTFITDNHPSTHTLGSSCGDVLAALMAKLAVA